MTFSGQEMRDNSDADELGLLDIAIAAAGDPEVESMGVAAVLASTTDGQGGIMLQALEIPGLALSDGIAFWTAMLDLANETSTSEEVEVAGKTANARDQPRLPGHHSPPLCRRGCGLVDHHQRCGAARGRPQRAALIPIAPRPCPNGASRSAGSLHSTRDDQPPHRADPDCHRFAAGARSGSGVKAPCTTRARGGLLTGRDATAARRGGAGGPAALSAG